VKIVEDGYVIVDCEIICLLFAEKFTHLVIQNISEELNVHKVFTQLFQPITSFASQLKS